MADLASRGGQMDDERLSRFVSSLREDGLVADDYDENAVLDDLKGIWKAGEALRTQSLHVLREQTALAALAGQARCPDYIEVKTKVAALQGWSDDGERTVHYRIVGRIPVVPGTNVHLQEALAGEPKKWDGVRLALYRTLVEKFGVAVQLYEVHPKDNPLVESTKQLEDLGKDAPDFDARLMAGFGLRPVSEEAQEG